MQIKNICSKTGINEGALHDGLAGIDIVEV